MRNIRVILCILSVASLCACTQGFTTVQVSSSPTSTPTTTAPSTPSISSLSFDAENNQFVVSGAGLSGITSSNASGIHGSHFFSVTVQSATAITLSPIGDFKINLYNPYTFSVSNGSVSATLDITFEKRYVSMVSANTQDYGDNLEEASAYCRALSAACEYDLEGVACGSTVYTDWRVPTAAEASVFVGIAALNVGDNSIWTSTPSSTADQVVRYNIVNGGWASESKTSGSYTRCVR